MLRDLSWSLWGRWGLKLGDALGETPYFFDASLRTLCDENGKLTVDENMSLGLPGLYAAGDCTGGILQISKAVYEGTKAAFSAISFIKKGE